MSLLRVLLAGLLCVQATTASSQVSPTDGLTVYADLRERVTYVSALDYDADAVDTGWFWTQRIRIAADINEDGAVGGRLNLLSAVQSGIEATPIHDNPLDVQEAFVRVGGGPVTLLAGRQEIALGSQRLLGTRDGTNVRRTWDGLRGTVEVGGWRADAFALQLVRVDTEGSFNDDSYRGRRLGGLYTTGSTGWSELDLYYFYSGMDQRLTIEGLADQTRHSLGARLFGEHKKWFWNWEGVYQFGDHGDNRIDAWTVATNTGYRFGGSWSPELMLSVNVASGDSEPDDGKLETFDALYPRGNYFSDLAQLGPANFFNINPYLTLRPREDVFISMDVNFHWRLELEDGVYGPPGNLIRLPGGSRERYVNTSYSFSVGWDVNRHVSLAMSLARAEPGAFIKDTGPADTADYAEFTLEVRL